MTERIRRVLTGVSVALLAGYFVMVLVQVFFRYVLSESLYWAEELVRGLMVWGVMPSSALVSASRTHIRVDALAPGAADAPHHHRRHSFGRVHADRGRCMVACRIAGISYNQSLGMLLPFIGAWLVVIIIVAYLPDLALWLPRQMQ